MSGNPQVLALLEEILDGKTPEEACRDCPELLSEVYERWQKFRVIDAQIGELIPGLLTASDVTAMPHVGGLPDVPGYEVEAVLGQGGMGVVYKARQCAVDRLVAIKMLLAGPFAGPQERERFRRETAALASLKHPNIVQVYDAGEVAGRPYFTMELIDGGSLTQKTASTPQPPRQAAEFLSTVAKAVQAAHHAGIVHRDLKPANILLSSDGTPKVSDFGLARRQDDGADLTRTGVPMGTPSYMAPEQAQGQKQHVGPAVDIYALGAILYELLTGRPPFSGASPLETLQQVIHQEPVAPARLIGTVPRDLDTICLKCLQKNPAKRYPSATALAEDLDRFLRGDAIVARPEGPIARLVRRIRKRPAFSAAVAASAFLLCVVVGGGLWVAYDRAADQRAKDAADAAMERAAEQDVNEMVQWLRKSAWREAGVGLELAKGRLGDRESPEISGRLAKAQRDLELALRLEGLSVKAETFPGKETYAAECEALFRDAGLGQVSESPEVVAERVRASDIRVALVRALDEWAYKTPDRKRRRWVEDVARLADPDTSGWRVLINDPNVLKDEAALQKLLETSPRPFPSLPVLSAIQNTLVNEKRDPLPLLLRIHAAYPGDFFVNYRLGSALIHTNPTEAIRYLQTAVGLRPNDVAAHVHLGNSLAALGRLDEALACFRRVEELAPTHYHRITVANVLTQLGRYDEAENQHRKNVSHYPGSISHQKVLWSFLVRHSRADEVLREWKTAIAAKPTDHNACHGYSELCLFLDRKEEYRSARQSLLSRFGETTEMVVAARTSWSCLLLPEEGKELRQAIALADRLATADQRRYRPFLSYFQFAEALANYRRGKFDRAITLLRGEASFVLGPAPRIVRAMALHGTGKESEARAMLAEAVLSHDWRSRQAQDHDGWLAHVLRREAEGLILPNLPSFLAGTYEPRDNDERLALLGVCQFTNRTLALSRLHFSAFAADAQLAKDPGTDHRYRAACAAALVGRGHGADVADLDEKEKKHWREQARNWLRKDVAAWEKLLSTSADRLRAAQSLTRWRVDPDLTGLRAPSELASLSTDERRDCLALWAEVDDLLNLARGTVTKP